MSFGPRPARATPFDYWRSSAYDAYPDDPVYQIRENPYTTPALTQDAHYTAYFRTWHKATVSASRRRRGPCRRSGCGTTPGS
ncbi:MAG: hypothetical protein ACLSAF_21920 [Intestinimonas sp.]